MTPVERGLSGLVAAVDSSAGIPCWRRTTSLQGEHAAAMFREQARVRYTAAEISAGSWAYDRGRLYVGTFCGWAAFDLATLDCIWSERDLLPTGCDVKGLQPFEEQVTLLGYTRPQSFDSPRDWGAALYTGRVGFETTGAALPLPPGNWRMVRRMVGEHVYLYDVTEGFGVASYNRSGQVWAVPASKTRKVVPVSDGLACLGEDRLLVLTLDGRVLCDRVLPLSDTHEWTTISAGMQSGLVLGGFQRETRAFALAWMQEFSDTHPHISECPLGRVFAGEVICRYEDDEGGCGNDIHHVARIEPLTETTALVALGGDGEELGACEGAAALGVVHSDRPDNSWTTQIIDELDGVSGLLRLPDGRILVDLCGDMRIYERPPAS